jgi:hypothetical protein
MLLQKIDELRQPPELGKTYLVPCLTKRTVHYEFNADESQYEWFDLEPEHTISRVTESYKPVFNLPHSDRENGQKEVHFHVDYRFVSSLDSDIVERPLLTHDSNIEYREMELLSETNVGATPVSLIANSKLKHKRIHKHKCPHRGYDLRSVKPVNGCIQCPLHGLMFDEKSGDLLKVKP